MRYIKYVCLFPMGLLCWSCFIHCPGMKTHINNNTLYCISNLLYFILFILNLRIIQHETYNKGIYIGLAFFCFLKTLETLSIPMHQSGILYSTLKKETFLWGLRLAASITLQFTILHIAIKHFFVLLSKRQRYCITLIINCCLITPMLILVMLFESTSMQHAIMAAYSITQLTIFFYGFILLKKDKPQGTYINPMIGFFFLYLTHTIFIESISEGNFLAVLCLNGFTLFYLIALFFILHSKLTFSKTDFGRFYDFILSSEEGLGALQIQRYQHKYHITLIDWTRYCIAKSDRWFPASLFFISLSIYFLEKDITIIVYFLIIIPVYTILFLFVNRLFKQRRSANHIIQQRKRRSSCSLVKARKRQKSKNS